MISQSIFVFTFILRVVLIYLVSAEKWVNFTRDYSKLPEGPMQNRFKTVMFSLQFLIYNIVPYFTLAFMHYENFKPNPKQH